MTAVNFVYWLQDFFEITAANPPVDGQRGLTEKQTEMVKRHLALVFEHDIDQKVQDTLNKIHSGVISTGDIRVRC